MSSSSFVNQILQSDALTKLKELESESINCILTDIPYNISRTNNFQTMKLRTKRVGLEFGEWDHNFDIKEYKILQNLLTKNGSMIIFHSFEQFNDIKNTFDLLEYKHTIIWEKPNPFPRNRDRLYCKNIEIASWLVKKKGKWTFNRQKNNFQTSVFRYPSESYKRLHPTQKNLNLIKDLIKIHTNENDIILDPFCGSGTTCLAAYQLGRKFIGIELNEDYVKIANKRIDPYLKQQKLIYQ